MTTVSGVKGSKPLLSRRAMLAMSAAAMVARPTSGFAASTMPSALEKRETITVAVQEKAGHMAALYLVGKSLDKMNISYNPVLFQRYPDSRTAILSGSVDLGSTGAAQVIQDVAGGGTELIALQGVAALKLYPIVRQGIEVKTWEDLKGKTIGVGVGGNAWTAFVAKLKETPIAYTDLKPVGIQGSGQNFNLALRRGDIDVSVCWSPFVEQALVDKIGYAPPALEFSYNKTTGPDQGMWVTTRQGIKTKKELIRRFIWAYNYSVAQLNGSKPLKLEAIENFTGTAPAVAELTSDWITYGNFVTQEYMAATAKLMADLGIVSKDVSGDMINHYDMSLYNEAVG